MGGGKLRRELGDGHGHRVQAIGKIRQVPGVRQVLREQGIEDRQQEQGVAARGDVVMFTGQLGGLGEARVDHHQLAAPAGELLDPLAHIRHRPQTAVGGDGIGPQHQEIVGAVDIRDRVQGLVAEQPQGGQVVGQLVHAGGGEAVVGAEVAKQLGLVGQHAVVVNRGVAQVGADGVYPVGVVDLHQSAGSGVQGLFPADFLPLAVRGLLDRGAQPVRVLVQVLEGHRLGTDMAAAEWIVLVAPDGDDLVAFRFNDDPADGLAQVAGPVVPLTAHTLASMVTRPRPEISPSRASRSLCNLSSSTSYSSSRVS